MALLGKARLEDAEAPRPTPKHTHTQTRVVTERCGELRTRALQRQERIERVVGPRCDLEDKSAKHGRLADAMISWTHHVRCLPRPGRATMRIRAPHTKKTDGATGDTIDDMANGGWCSRVCRTRLSSAMLTCADGHTECVSSCVPARVCNPACHDLPR